ncbi:MAG: FAD-linked oxidase C-terminal domain-containing protein [Planctomycetota bacterium]|nr:FAD-linked oxidase C-terminal domain-containing protein [Planctomycetota bacterium]
MAATAPAPSPGQIEQLADTLRSRVNGEVRFDQVSRAFYSTDASVYQILPHGVVIPKSYEDVIHVVHSCAEHGVSITARGGGTSQAGQAVGGGVQLDFSKYLNRVIEFDPDKRTVRVQAGIVLDELNEFLKPYDLQLPLDLSTSNRATIGGMVGNNSAGTRSVVYGKTIDYVQSLTAVLSDGNVVELQAITTEQLAEFSACGDLEGNCYRIVKQLAAEHATEIRRRYPNILRRVGGYNLDAFVDTSDATQAPLPGPPKRPELAPDCDADFNLARLIVGAEGTLALVLEVCLRLVPRPKTRTLCTIQFHDLLEALGATPAILEHGPAAVELVDRFILDTTRGKPQFEPFREFIEGDPAAVLIVEFLSDEECDLAPQVDRLEQALDDLGLGYRFHRAHAANEQGRIWGLRRAALGLSMSQRGDAKAISFVEDTAVAPERLRDYIARFIAILENHQLTAGFYAHASVGLLHIRPVVNMKTAEGVEHFEQVATEVADLVLEFGGAVSGEHGDGLARSPFQEKMFGPTLYQAFRKIKHTFDPDNVFNPGKIVDAPGIQENLRFGSNYETRPVKTLFDFSDFGGLARAAEQCGGVGACRKTLSGTMCPSFMATREEADSTRGRANALRLAISGQLSNAGIGDAQLEPVLDLCLECKACKTECPTGVDVARMKSEYLHQLHQQTGVPRRVRLFAHTAHLARWGSRLAPFSNWLLRSYPIRLLNEYGFGLDRRRYPPSFARRTFLDWWHRHHTPNITEPVQQQTTVALFADTFSNYFEPAQAIATTRLAETMGVRVIVPEQVCCGRPLISKGLLDEAQQQASRTTATLFPLVAQGIPILFCEPSCYSAVVDDHPHLLRGAEQERASQVANSCQTFEQWAATTYQALTSEFPFSTGPEKILVHGHCHQKALTGTKAMVELLNAIPGSTVTELDTGCCGMAGSFGYEREHFDVSRAIGRQKLFPAIEASRAHQTGAPDTCVVAPGFSCRQQIAHFTAAAPVSPATLLESLLPERRQ